LRLSLTKGLILGVAARIVLSLYTQHAATYAKFTSLDQLFIIGANPLVRITGFGTSFYLFYSPFYLLYWLISTQLGFSYDFLLNALIKAPPIIGDLITSYALYHIGIVITNQQSKARLLALSYFLNPYAIWITSIVGHAESLWVGFLLLSLVYLQKNSTRKGAASLALATMFRFLPLVLLPFFVYYVIRTREKFRKFALTYLGITAILAAPYVISIVQIYQVSPRLVLSFLDHFVGGASAVQSTGNYGIESIKTFAYNFTGILANLGLWPALSSVFGFSNYLVVLVLLMVVVLKRGFVDFVGLGRSILMSYCLLLIFIPLVQHEYFSWILPFLLMELVVPNGLPRFLPYVLTATALLIDPITQGSFYYYAAEVFPLQSSLLVAGWPLNIPSIYVSISALHVLLISFAGLMSLLALLGVGLRDGRV